MIANISIMEIDKHAFVLLNTIWLITTIGMNTCNQIIVIAASSCFPNHGLHIYATAG